MSPLLGALSGPFSETYHFSYSFFVFGIETWQLSGWDEREAQRSTKGQSAPT